MSGEEARRTPPPADLVERVTAWADACGVTPAQYAAVSSHRAHMQAREWQLMHSHLLTTPTPPAERQSQEWQPREGERVRCYGHPDGDDEGKIGTYVSASRTLEYPHVVEVDGYHRLFARVEPADPTPEVDEEPGVGAVVRTSVIANEGECEEAVRIESDGSWRWVYPEGGYGSVPIAWDTLTRLYGPLALVRPATPEPPADEAETVIERAVGTIAAHWYVQTEQKCNCGWRWQDGLAHEEHVARALHAAGLLRGTS